MFREHYASVANISRSPQLHLSVLAIFPPLYLSLSLFIPPSPFLSLFPLAPLFFFSLPLPSHLSTSWSPFLPSTLSLCFPHSHTVSGRFVSKVRNDTVNSYLTHLKLKHSYCKHSGRFIISCNVLQEEAYATQIICNVNCWILQHPSRMLNLFIIMERK